MPRNTRRNNRRKQRRNTRTRSARKTYRRKQCGGLVEEYETTLNSMFGRQWIITGSEAVRLLTIYHNLASKYPITPGDVDVIYVHNDLFYATEDDDFNGYRPVQKRPTQSMTFENEETGRSFDMLIMDRAQYCEYPIEGRTYRIMDPRQIYREYTDPLTGYRAKDSIKIQALQEILALPKPSELMTMKPAGQANSSNDEGYSSRFDTVGVSKAMTFNNDDDMPVRKAMSFNNDDYVL